ITRNNKLAFKPLFRDELVAIVGRDHRLASRASICARDFASEHLLVYDVPKEDLTVFQKLLLPAGVSPRQLSRIELTEAIIEMVKAGLGIGVMARWAVEPQVKSGVLRALSLTKRGLYRQWHAAMLKNRAAPPYLLKFVELTAGSSALQVRNGSKRSPALPRHGLPGGSIPDPSRRRP
ncbi:MAG TPA: LysR substrate-binding domain-containing protein, partial [Blastocatellia bacterium]|nr:LysR substrate-binding domain-containing protein [Blastocatellia bacterium]